MHDWRFAWRRALRRGRRRRPCASKLPPFDQDEARLDFIREISAAANVPVKDEVIHQGFKSFPLGRFAPLESYAALIAALDRFVDQARE